MNVVPGKVLIVDDDQEPALVVLMRLDAAGYEPAAAFNGEHALATSERFNADVIVMDVRTPLIDVLQALVEFRKRGETRQTPVIMLSARVGDKIAARKAPARYFLRNPHDGRVLCRRIHSVLHDGPHDDECGMIAAAPAASRTVPC